MISNSLVGFIEKVKDSSIIFDRETGKRYGSRHVMETVKKVEKMIKNKKQKYTTYKGGQ